MQVFYVNIGGGEPTVRPDFWELLDYADRPPRRREVLHQRQPHHPRARAARLAAQRLRRRADLPRRRDRRGQRRRPRRRAPTTPRSRRWRTWPTPASSGFKISVVCTRQNVDQLDEFKAIADRYGAQLRLTRLRPSGRGADVWDELHPTADQQRELYDWLVAHGENVLTGDSFFHLAALRRGAARPEPVRRRPGGLPDRPGRRRLRLPVRDPRRVPGRQRARATAASQRSGATRTLFAELREPQTGGAARRARPTTPAAAAAWRRSSSPACRSTGPTPSASRGTARPRWPVRPDHPAPRRQDHSKAAAQSGTRDRSSPMPAPARTASCDESPLAGPRPHRHGDRLQERSDGRHLVRVRRRGPAAGEEAAARAGVRRPGRRLRAGPDRSTTTSAAFAELGFAPHVAGLPAERDDGHHGDGPGDLAAGADLARPACRPCTPTARSPWPGPRPPRGTVMGLSAPSPASRSRRSSRPTRRRSSRCTGCGDRDAMVQRMRARPRRRRRRA